MLLHHSSNISAMEVMDGGWVNAHTEFHVKNTIRMLIMRVATVNLIKILILQHVH